MRKTFPSVCRNFRSETHTIPYTWFSTLVAAIMQMALLLYVTMLSTRLRPWIKLSWMNIAPSVWYFNGSVCVFDFVNKSNRTFWDKSPLTLQGFWHFMALFTHSFHVAFASFIFRIFHSKLFTNVLSIFLYPFMTNENNFNVVWTIK